MQIQVFYSTSSGKCSFYQGSNLIIHFSLNDINTQKFISFFNQLDFSLVRSKITVLMFFSDLCFKYRLNSLDFEFKNIIIDKFLKFFSCLSLYDQLVLISGMSEERCNDFFLIDYFKGLNKNRFINSLKNIQDYNQLHCELTTIKHSNKKLFDIIKNKILYFCTGKSNCYISQSIQVSFLNNVIRLCWSKNNNQKNFKKELKNFKSLSKLYTLLYSIAEKYNQ